MRRPTIFVIFMAFLVGAGLFQLKYEVMKLEGQYKQIHRSIKNSKESISILNAEWSHLVSPERLQLLAEKHLLIAPVSGSQLISFKVQSSSRESEKRVFSQPTNISLDQLVSNVLENND